MRRSILALAVAAPNLASACSGANVEEMIRRNVVISYGFLAVSVGVLGFSLLRSLRLKQPYWIPIFMTVPALGSLTFIQGAYNGDCGDLGLTASFFTAALSLIAVGWQLLFSRYGGKAK
jgi:hypothetical protein